MVLGLAAPAVQASSTDNSSVSGILDGIYIPEGTDGTVIINGEDVTEEVKNNTFDDLPSLGEMTTPTTAPSTPVAVDLCQCVDLPTAEDHPGVCKVKAPYIELCNTASEQELCEKWASYNYEEQTLMREYLQQNAPLKLVELDRLLSAPTGSASETLTNGTTVSVEGIPEYSSLTVADAADEVKDIVDAYVAENEAASTELFSYDVSIQDAEGADWQPNTTVKMELELPGEKLHKYSKVYVVHVDDNGVATTIEAEVTEDGKIAFETPGFSTFVGFTVDFEFNGIQISIPGMSSIKLSELLDSLKVPVYAEDVVNVTYTDDTQLKIEQLEGDWLLTSLKPFTTDEMLTLFMADGAVYEIKVTDDIVGQRADSYFAYAGATGNTCALDVTYYSGESHNGVLTVKVSNNSGNGITTGDNTSSYYQNSHWWNRRVVIDGSGINDNFTGGALEICIEKNGTGDNFKVPVVNWYITDGAIVNVYLQGFDSNDTISFESWIDGSPMFTVDDGTLYFNVDESVLPDDSSTNSGKIHNFQHTTCSYKELILDGYNNVEDNEDAIIFANDGADNLYVNGVEFTNSARRALYIRADQMDNCRLDNCIFDSTIKSTNGGGGAIYIAEKTSGGAWVNVDNLTLRYCEFDQNTVGSTEKNDDGTYKVVRGGAVLIWGNLNSTTFYECKFYKTNATAQGGAVSIGDQKNTFNQGNITFEKCEFDGTTNGASLAGAVLICQLSDELMFKDCLFKNVTGAGHGGVIHIGGTDDVGIGYASFTMTGCSFTNCKTTGGRGGVLRLYSATANPVTITDCTFSTCSSSSLGGALSFQGNIGTLTISGTAANKSSFTSCQSTAERGGAISLDATIAKCEIKDTSFSTCKSLTKTGGAIYHGGTTGDFDVTNCSFSSCEAKIYGGAIALYGRTTTTDITGGSFTSCKAGGTQAMYEKDGKTPILDKKGNHMYNGTGGGAAICIVQNHGTINIGGTSTKNQTYTSCESLNSGGAISFEGDCEVQTCNIQYVYIDGCKARDSGTAILLGDVTVVNMSIMDSEIKNCTYISGRTGTSAIENSMYDEYYTEGMEYDDIIFRTNDSCGTIRTIGSCKAQLTVENVDFTNNTSFTGGGGIYWNANRVAGYADDKDGPYTFTNSLTIKNCDFTGNKALRDGGAIYVEASLTVEGGTFKNNAAQRGGAIAQQLYNNSGRPIQSGETNNLIIKSYTSGSTTTKAVFDENYARKHGGAISVLCNATASITTTEDAEALAYPITCEITGAEIKNNRAAENGGGVYFYQMSYPTDYADPSDKTETDAKLDNKEVEAYVKSLKLDGATIHSNYSGCGKDKLTTPESANGSGHGGGIYLNAKKNTTLQVLGCTVYSNTAHFGNGGGIYMTGEGGVCQMKANAAGTATVIGGAADKGNKATSSAPGTAEGQNTGNGGGIGIFTKGRIEMQGGTVSYNTAETAGGGIAVNGSTMEFSDGTVTNNTAKYGGGISLTKSGDPATIADESLENPPVLTPAWGMVFTNGTVTNNVADIGGGICVSNSSTMKLDGGKVNTNYAATKSGSSSPSYKAGQHGGGIAVVASSKMNIYAGEVKSNHAGRGGGITVQGGSALQMLPKPGSTAAGTVSYNTAETAGGGYGGGIYLAPKASDGNKNTLYVDNGTIEKNNGYNGAGIAVLQEGEATLSGGKIYQNKGVNNNALGGGAYVYGAKLTISGAELSYNYGQNSGGAIYLRTTYDADGAIPSELSITGGSIHHNHTKAGWGGGIYMLGKDSKTTVSGGKIYENYTELSGSHGGGINAEHHSTLKIEGGEIYKNTAASNGGGIHAHTSATINIDDGSIYSNTASGNGGGINVYGSVTVNIDGGSIYSNTASSNAGGILAEGSKVAITGGSIYGNTATAGTGGGLYAHSSATVEITGGDIYNNTAATYGGGMHVSSKSTLTFKGGEIRDNTSGSGGGGIAVSWLSNATVSTSDDGKKIGKIMNNTAVMGGGLYVECSALTVKNGYIINNKAVGQPASTVTTAYQQSSALIGVGGGVCLAGASSAKGTFTLTGNKIAIYGNTADFAADDVFSNGNNTTLTIPTVDQMDLEGFDFPAEGWVEDYCTKDSEYKNEKALNMMKLHADRAEANGVQVPDDLLDNGATRYRNTPAMYRNYMLIEPEYVTGKKADGTAVSGTFVNMNNAYVCMTLGIPGTVDDTVVIDYVAPVNINLWQNDMFMDQADFADKSDGSIGSAIGWIFPDNTTSNGGIHYTSGANGARPVGRYPDDYTGIGKVYGSAYNGKNGALTYVPTKIAITGTDQFFYTVKHNDYWYYAKVTIVPATTLYFDDTDSHVKYYTNSESKETLAEWKVYDTYKENRQDEDRPGDALMDALDKNNVYGHDSSYANTKTFSNGDAHRVTVSHHDAIDSNGDGTCDLCKKKVRHGWADANNDQTCDICGVKGCQHNSCKDLNNDNLCDACKRQMEHTCIDNKPTKNHCDICGRSMGRHSVNARASFTFTGTGFDIVSLCSVNTGMVMVNVYRGDSIDFDNPDSSKYVTSYMVDTYLKYRYDEETQQWVEASPNDSSIYQIYQVPVIKADLTKVVETVKDDNNDGILEYTYMDCGYDTYTVEIYVAPGFLETEAGYWSADFYLDAIRIHNPAGVGNFKNAVKDDVIQQTYLADNEGWPEYVELRNMFIKQKDLPTTERNGIIFIDGQTNPTLDDYKSWGPNNEVYLDPGQSIAFKMDMTGYTNVAGIQVGIRGLTGKSSAYIACGTSAANSTFFKHAGVSTTDMYYDLSIKNADGTFRIANKVVVISNQGANPIAITNIKITHKAQPTNQRSYKMLKANANTAEVALSILNARDLVDHPVVTPERPALSFNGMVCYNVFFSATNMGDLPCEDVGLAVFSTEDTEGTIETAREVIYGATKIDGMYMTSTSGVHAKNLGDKQYFRAFAKRVDGSLVYSKMVSYSAVDYAMNVLAKSDDVKLKQLVVAMLNYGAEAQKFFGYNTDDLMNKDLTADDQALLAGFDANSLNTVGKVDASKVGVFASNGGFAKKSPAISFKGAFEINYFFTPDNVVDDGMTLYIWNEDTYNSVSELTAENADKVVDMTLENGVYTASSDEIAAKYLDKTVYVAAVYQCDDITYCSGVLPYSIAAYCQNPPATVQDLATAAAIYGCTAKQYFGV